MVLRKIPRIIFNTMYFLPNKLSNKIALSKQLTANSFQVVLFMVIN